jgi:hypothetical protein
MESLQNIVDLHIHTRCSDGGLTPDEVIEYAASRGLRAVAITDHDTIAGNAPALTAAARAGLEAIPGVEISTHWEGITFHVLGYGMRRVSETVRRTFAFLEESRRQRNPRIAEKLRRLGVEITFEEVVAEAGASLVGRPHFARVLLKKGAVDSQQEAFDRYLGRGAAAYVDKERLAPADACKVIHEAGGVVVLAHPGLVEQDHPGRLPALLKELSVLGLTGIEAYYSRHTPGQTARYLELARRLGLIVTGGSDFHRRDEPGPDLGTGFGELRVPYSCFESLLRKIAAASR